MMKQDYLKENMEKVIGNDRSFSPWCLKYLYIKRYIEKIKSDQNVELKKEN